MTNMQLCTLSGWLAWQHYIWNVLCAALNLYQFVTNLFHSLELWCKWETALKGSFKKMLRKYEMILNWNWDYWEPVYSIFTILLRLMKITKIHQMHGCKNVQTGQCYFSGANFWARHAKIMSILLIALANITVDKIKNLETLRENIIKISHKYLPISQTFIWIEDNFQVSIQRKFEKQELTQETFRLLRTTLFHYLETLLKSYTN